MPKTIDELQSPRRAALIIRRRVFTALVGISIVTLVIGLFPGMGAFLRIHLSLDLMLVGFVMYLLSEKYRKVLLDDTSAHQADEIEDPDELDFLKAEHF